MGSKAHVEDLLLIERGVTLPSSMRKRHRFDLWVGKIPLEEGMATHSSILAWKIP